MMNKILAVFSATFLLASCQQKPTKIVSQSDIIAETVTAETLMKENPILLDVRSPFEFNLLHVPQAINIQWQDFSKSNGSQKGYLQEDLFAVARRLSLIGVDPETPVVILGNGLNGNAEEGRLAWTLKVLGVERVYTLIHNSYREVNPKEDAPLVRNKPYWKPKIDKDLSIDSVSFMAYLTKELPSMTYSSKARSKALGGVPAGALDQPVRPLYGLRFSEAKSKVVIMDVRSAEEFSLPNKYKSSMVNLNWKEFFNAKGLVSVSVENKLKELGVSKDNIVILISNHGVRSGAVTYALRSLGYKATNFSGGYDSL